MKMCNSFFAHLGRHRVKLAVGKYHIPQIVGLLHDLGVEQGVISPTISAEHGVLPERVEIPVEEPVPPVAPAPPTLEDLAKEEVLSLLRSTSPVSPALPLVTPVEDKETETEQPAPPTKDKAEDEEPKP